MRQYMVLNLMIYDILAYFNSQTKCLPADSVQVRKFNELIIRDIAPMTRVYYLMSKFILRFRILSKHVKDACKSC